MRSIVLFILLLLSFAADAQTREVIYPPKDTLLARRKQIMAAIEETERELQAIKSDKQATIGQLRALQSKLADRQRLIGNINDELGEIDRDIRNSSKEVMTLKQKLEQLNTRYAQSLRYSYSTRSSYDMLAFLFSSRDFNEAMRRMKYLKKFRDFRKYQMQQITHTQVQLKQKIGVLSEEKTKKDQVLNAQVQQKQILQRETEQTNQVVQDLKSKESKLLADIEKNKKVNARINKAISDLIEREMAKAAKAAEAEAKKSGIDVKTAGKSNIKSNSGGGPEVAVNEVPKTTTAKAKAEVSLMLTPENVELAENFEGNKGKMYWPVERGFITGRFGVRPHPLFPKVMIENAGVNIQTDKSANVRSVFDGTVSKIFSVAGSNWIVMVVHGNYFTVYNGLESLSVKVNDVVKAKQVIGKVALNDEELPVIDFQVWKSVGDKRIKLDPEQWLGKLR